MAMLSAIFLVVAVQAANAPPPTAGSWQARTGAEVSARATVRILPGARVRFGGSAEADTYRSRKASVRLEDGSTRPAELVEFQ